MEKITRPLSIFFVILLAAGLPIWFVSYNQYPKLVTISEILTLLLSIFFFAVSERKKRPTFLVIITGFLLAVSIKIIIDTLIDPTSHNLWPFEVLIYVLFAFIIALIGLGLGMAIKRILWPDR